MDMYGQILKEFPIPYEGVCYGLKKFEKNYFILSSPNLIILDEEFKVNKTLLPKKNRFFHHDFWVFEDKIYILSQGLEEVQIGETNKKINNQWIEVYNLKGKFIEETSFFEILNETIQQEKIENLVNSRYLKEEIKDIFHSNTLQILEKDYSFGKKGNALISLRNMDLIAVIDLNKKKIVWQWGPGNLSGPHQPSIIQNDNLLIFDNGVLKETEPKQSRIIKLDPIKKEIIWEYNPKEFYTSSKGGVYELKNGNLLITESNKGHVFEINKEKEIVWEWWNPLLDNKTNSIDLYRMTRFDEKTLKGLIKNENKRGLIT
jgi:hypothetical protein